ARWSRWPVAASTAPPVPGMSRPAESSAILRLSRGDARRLRCLPTTSPRGAAGTPLTMVTAVAGGIRPRQYGAALGQDHELASACRLGTSVAVQTLIVQRSPLLSIEKPKCGYRIGKKRGLTVQ